MLATSSVVLGASYSTNNIFGTLDNTIHAAPAGVIRGQTAARSGHVTFAFPSRVTINSTDHGMQPKQPWLPPLPFLNEVLLPPKILPPWPTPQESGVLPLFCVGWAQFMSWKSAFPTAEIGLLQLFEINWCTPECWVFDEAVRIGVQIAYELMKKW